MVAGKAETRRQILIYTSLLVPLSFAPLVVGMDGIAYGAAAGMTAMAKRDYQSDVH